MDVYKSLTSYCILHPFELFAVMDWRPVQPGHRPRDPSQVLIMDHQLKDSGLSVCADGGRNSERGGMERMISSSFHIFVHQSADSSSHHVCRPPRLLDSAPVGTQTDVLIYALIRGREAAIQT